MMTVPGNLKHIDLIALIRFRACARAKISDEMPATDRPTVFFLFVYLVKRSF